MAVTDFGRDWVIARLSSCHTVQAIDDVWADLAEAYQADATISAFYGKRKFQMERRRK